MRQVPEKGDRVTMSSSKQTGDRSYCHDVFKVVAVNATHIKAQAETGFWADREPQIIQISEYDFSLAEDF